MISGQNLVLFRPLCDSLPYTYMGIRNRLERDPTAPKFVKISGRMFIDKDHWDTWSQCLSIPTKDGRGAKPLSVVVRELVARVACLEHQLAQKEMRRAA